MCLCVYVLERGLRKLYPILPLLISGLMEVSSHHPGVGPGGEDINVLEAEITELQRENARVESQMLRLRTDITAMEAHLRHDKVRTWVVWTVAADGLPTPRAAGGAAT